MQSPVYLNQSLHGYADGHQLLASSVDLTKDQQSLILVMSDLSGPAFRNGFESYLTGYGLVGSRIYCFARTWFAPELPRPGCVWTQTILIRDEDVAQIRDFRAVNRLFRRPTIGSYAAYEHRLQLNAEDHLAEPVTIEPSPVMAGLYGSPKAIVIPDESSGSFEDMVLSVMSQQWPRLRRSFRFCTGALSIRDAEFDLSISPPEIIHSVGADGLVVPRNGSFDGSREGWLDVARSDLLADDNQSDYRKFLWQFGPDHQDGRAAFKPLSELFSLLQGGQHVGLADSLLSAVSHYFPQPSEARRIKYAFFGSSGSYATMFGGEAEILKLLVSHPSASSIPNDATEIRRRATQLTELNIEAAIEIAALAVQLGGENGQLFLDGFLDVKDWSAKALESSPIDLTAMILDRHPKLIASAGLWSREDRVAILSRFFSRLRDDESLLVDTLSGVIQAEAVDAANVIIDRFGAVALRAIFQVVEAGSDGSIAKEATERMIPELAITPPLLGELFGADAIGPRVLALLSAQIDPRSWSVRAIKKSLVLEAAKQSAQFDSKLQKLRSDIFFLSLGLSSWDDQGSKVVSMSFSHVYEAAKQNLIDNSLWERLEPNLSWHSPSWDKCARLIKTVSRAFKERKWQLELFCDVFKTPEQVQRALQEIDDMWSGGRLVKRLKDAVSNGELKASSEQLSAIEAFES